MAKNMRRAYSPEKTLAVPVSSPASPNSGDPCIYGVLPCVALTNKNDGGNATGNTTVATDGDWLLSVKGIDAGGNSAVAAGDALYYTGADTPPVSKKATGTLFGVAIGTVTSGATATIEVRLGRG
jgi:predicted RecA/RadA family phage recombinase